LEQKISSKPRPHNQVRHSLSNRLRKKPQTRPTVKLQTHKLRRIRLRSLMHQHKRLRLQRTNKILNKWHKVAKIPSKKRLKVRSRLKTNNNKKIKLNNKTSQLVTNKQIKVKEFSVSRKNSQTMMKNSKKQYSVRMKILSLLQERHIRGNYFHHRLHYSCF
jgi:hypothetical protein